MSGGVRGRGLVTPSYSISNVSENRKKLLEHCQNKCEGFQIRLNVYAVLILDGYGARATLAWYLGITDHNFGLTSIVYFR